MAKYTPVGASEKCPCGSDKFYLDCCLDKGFKYVRDENGKVIKLQSEYGIHKRENQENEDYPEIAHIHPIIVIEITDDGAIVSHAMIRMDMQNVSVCELKSIMSFIERQKAVITLALTKGGARISQEKIIPIVLIGYNDEKDIVMVGGAFPEDLQGLDQKELLEIIDVLESVRMDLMAVAIHKCVNSFLFPHGYLDRYDEEGGSNES